MSEKLARAGDTWRFTCAAPVREVFASMEQMLGMPPYRFEFVDRDRARIIEVSRCGFFGQWTKKVPNPGWITCQAVESEAGTQVVVTASMRPRNLLRGPKGVPGVPARALQLVQLLTRGEDDGRTIYRRVRIAPGPVTLVASWAGMPYPLFTEPSHDATRGREVRTATPLVATGRRDGLFVQVRLGDGAEGWIEQDQIVPAPAEAIRRAGALVADRMGLPQTPERL